MKDAPKDHAPPPDETLLGRELPAAMRRGELALRLRPIVAGRNGRWCAAEVEPVWQHPLYGVLPPPLLARVARHCGMRAALGDWLLDTVLADLKRWSHLAPQPFRIHLRASLGELSVPHAQKRVLDALRQHGIGAGRLVLALPESVVAQAAEQCQPGFASLRALGARIALAGFGNGYSTLGLLREMPIDELWIDPRLVGTLALPEPRGMAIVSAAIEVARALDLEIGARGVDSRPQRVALRTLGCDALQGDAIAPPLVPDAFLRRLLGEPAPAWHESGDRTAPADPPRETRHTYYAP
ncbi:hypothetical protein BKK81_31470 [Cupriavidus sp. USMAHM13]|uniref:EAL domain-containing protein n=1 Tax=Cupriavidus malaysiensis TaxID=367825 RepID=A0ABM6FBG2_9BURK|nr:MULTISPECIES: EAL domain-containing protein [Cupriavidus]AOZ03564.1 hypothetical protein BKK81_31470 [Cupriavidus sp. USMAHM13]AOZ09073.1 hypothetical protein BKK80_24880 [Cupriavidus malaysiensis]